MFELNSISDVLTSIDNDWEAAVSRDLYREAFRSVRYKDLEKEEDEE